MSPRTEDLERVLTLKRLAFFRYLPLETLLALSRVLEAEALLAGDVIRPGGGRIDHVYILETGRVRVVAGEMATTLRAPAHFGEIALVGELVRCERIDALEPSRLLRLQRIVFDDLARDHPEIVMELCKLLAKRLRQADPGEHDDYLGAAD